MSKAKNKGNLNDNSSWKPPTPAIPDGFTAWRGEGKPDLHEDTEVWILRRNELRESGLVKEFTWDWAAPVYDYQIIGYRVIRRAADTVMVKVLRSDAKKMADDATKRLSDHCLHDRVGLACRDALEPK